MATRNLNEFDSIRIMLASPERIRDWSHGEVKKPETINYRTLRPEREGLFCERIFGTTKDWECYCGKFKSIRYKGVICDRCGVEVTHSKVRRERMGHVELATPVAHIWYYRSVPSRMGLLLNMTINQLKSVLYYERYVIIDPSDSGRERGELIDEEEHYEYLDEYGDKFVAMIGGDAVKELLSRIDVDGEIREIRQKIAEGLKASDRRLLKRLEVLEALRESGNRPEWMMLDVTPVIPPELRPMVQLEGGRFATSDLNDLYRRVINRNNRLKRLLALKAPDIIVRNEKRMLQEAVDALFDNSRRKRSVKGKGNRPLKSLSDMLKGKSGRFRQNLLGKRVDYSGRSVIVIGPELKLHQMGLPKKMALELFKPFIMKRLVDLDLAPNIKSAKKKVEAEEKEVFEALDEVIKEHPVMLNRAPTLHRLGIQAFLPTLVEGKAIKLHPLVCKAFNADFDGDQMAVHLPLSIEAQVEAHTLMMSTNNIFAPANGKPIMSPSQDTVMGCYYITMVLPNRRGQDMVFASLEESDMAFSQGAIDLHAKIKVRLPGDRRVYSDDGRTKYGALVETTYGRVMFNMMLPEGMDFYNQPLKSGDLASVISDCYQRLGRRPTIQLLDDMMQLGFRESTRSGLSFATDDLVTPDHKQRIISEAEKKVLKFKKLYDRGVITDQERYNQVLDTWTHAREQITSQMMSAMEADDRGGLGYVNPVFLMAHSGARGGVEQIRQLAGMRGLMAKPTGEIIETPIKANFREGLSVLEYFSSTHGARKGLADTALKTA
ncbi:MAG: DNA-directed RNA polymerase subunit beta', partial [Leptospiraceae bacterium]|nr:DNA-directed RNA polymerase subunit beta' [Leptospiraceae bacterium]